MKKWLSVVLSITIIALSCVALSPDNSNTSADKITKEEAYQFADELKEMKAKEYDVANRLIVSADKKIDYLDAVDVATGIDDLYVVQFDDEASVKNAEKYYNSLDYVNYVEYDKNEQVNALCSVDDSKYTPQCFSTVNSYIDDAIKFANELQGGNMPEIKVGVMDTGIETIGYDRVLGGYNFSDDTTSFYDNYGHGSKVMGVILLNTPDNVKIMGYKVLTDEGYELEDHSSYVAAFHMAVADGCRVVNCSFGSIGSKAIEEAINYAADNGCILVGAAGNNSNNIAHYPGKYDRAICVGAVSESNRIANFSNYGDDVDIYAAGSGIKYEIQDNRVTSSFSGTSAATPMVASICAIITSANPEFTPEQIKEAIVNTGYATNEENINGKDRTVANAYEALKYITGKELPQVQLTYELTENSETGFSDISFTADEDATIFYTTGSGGDLYIPYYDQGVMMEEYKSCYQYEKGTTVNLKKYCTITVCAYAPGKAKSKIEYIMAPAYANESGFLISEASSTKEFNSISRCQFINQKTIEVPQYINGVEVQKIDKYCFMGNPTVEKIILPESVKQIDYYAFVNCLNLKEVIAPGVEICGMYAFSDCKNLVNVEMPNVTVANTGMFKNCTSLETAKLGTLTEIDNHAFYGCENLKLVKTTADNISFAVNTFKDCNTLTIYTPDKNTSMYSFGKENGIPVIISFNYKYSGWSREGFIYEDKELSDKVTYPAGKIYKMWGAECINQPPDYDELGFLLNTVDDNIINAKDFSFINKHQNT